MENLFAGQASGNIPVPALQPGQINASRPGGTVERLAIKPMAIAATPDPLYPLQIRSADRGHLLTL